MILQPLICAWSPLSRRVPCKPLGAHPMEMRKPRPTHRVVVGDIEHSDHLASVAHSKEGAVMGKGHIRHGALGLQDLALILERRPQDGVDSDVAVLQVKTRESALVNRAAAWRRRPGHQWKPFLCRTVLLWSLPPPHGGCPCSSSLAPLACSLWGRGTGRTPPEAPNPDPVDQAWWSLYFLLAAAWL